MLYLQKIKFLITNDALLYTIISPILLYPTLLYFTLLGDNLVE